MWCFIVALESEILARHVQFSTDGRDYFLLVSPTRKLLAYYNPSQPSAAHYLGSVFCISFLCLQNDLLVT